MTALVRLLSKNSLRESTSYFDCLPPSRYIYCTKKYETNKLNEKYTPNSKFNHETQSGLSADNIKDSDSIFSIILPPPNITGSLHLGHALTVTLQDVLCRWKRMNGVKVFWVPGKDHAGIATQMVVEKYLAKNNLNRENLGYENFLEEVWKWKEKNGTEISEQLKSLNASLDWSREVFTMDKKQNNAVKEAFIRLFDEGLIYRAKNLINWSCYLKSTISDIEVENVEITGAKNFNIPGYSDPIKFGLIYEFAYKIDGCSNEIVVATTRPETILGDVAVAVHPNDKRYSHLIGCRLKHPFSNKTIPLITDDSVDINFGTGAVKITPAHDRNDFIISKKYNLEAVPVIDDHGLIEDSFQGFSGMKRFDARGVIVNELKNQNLLKNIREHNMSVPLCSRSGDVIELLLRSQWFINCKELSENAFKATENDSLELIPDEFKTVWNNWSEKELDWCISRQLWWGHRIPAYKCHKLNDADNSIWIAARDEEEAKYKSSKILKTSDVICKQDTDVLDTWFSSAIYPFSCHDWPDITSNYKKLYPLNIMITGHDILCFWVYRMVILGMKLTGQLPFSKALLHGIICDSKGAKMSKSKGNVIDPQDIINGISLDNLKNKAKKSCDNGSLNKKELEAAIKTQEKQYPNGIPECGADALRFTLCSRNVKHMYINFDIEDCISNYHFCNKIWQSVRYVNNIMTIVDEKTIQSCTIHDLQLIDRWLLSRLAALVRAVENSLNSYDFYISTIALRQFLYSEMCDTYIEFTKYNFKVRLDGKKMAANCHTFSASLNTALRLLSPFMPNISNELIMNLPQFQNCIINYYDSPNNLAAPVESNFTKWHNEILNEEINFILQLISAVRRLKSTYKISKNIKTLICVDSENETHCEVAIKYSDIIKFMLSCDEIFIKNKSDTGSKIWSYCYNDSVKVFLMTPDLDQNSLITMDEEILTKKIMKLQKQLNKLQQRVAAEGFERAPKEIQISCSNKIIALKDEIEKLNTSS